MNELVDSLAVAAARRAAGLTVPHQVTLRTRDESVLSCTMIPRRRVATRLWAGVTLLLGALAVPLAVAPDGASRRPPRQATARSSPMWRAGSATATAAGSASGAPTGGRSTAASRGSRSSTPTTAARSTAVSPTRRFRVRLTDWDDVSTLGVISASSTGALERIGDRLRVAVRGRGRAQLRSRSTARRRSAVPAGRRFPFRWSTWRSGAVTATAVRQLQTLLNHFGASLTSTAASATRPRAPSIGFQNTSGSERRRASGTSTTGPRRSPDWRARGSIPWTLLTPSPGRRADRVLHAGRRRQRGVGCRARRVRDRRDRSRTTAARSSCSTPSGPNRVVNQLDVELYLRGVVPREVSRELGLGRRRSRYERAAGAGRRGPVVRAQGIALLVRQDVRHVVVPGLRRGGDAAGADVGRLHHRRAGAQQPGRRRHRHRRAHARRRARLDRVLGVERPAHGGRLVPRRRRPVGRRARQSAAHVDAHHRRRRDRHQVRAAERQRDRHRARQRIDASTASGPTRSCATAHCSPPRGISATRSDCRRPVSS